MKDEAERRKMVAAAVRRVANYRAQKEKKCIAVQNHLQNNEKLSTAESIHLHNCQDCQFLKRLLEDS